MKITFFAPSDPSDPKNTKKEISELAPNIKINAVACDVSTNEGREKLLAACPEPDILVNNNGGPPFRDFREIDRDAIIEGVDMNMITPIELVKAVVDGMIKREFGRIVNITSVSVKRPVVGLDLSSGARAGLIQPDEKTFKYLENKPMSPKKDKWNKALDYWRKLKSDDNCKFDKEVTINGNDVVPQVTWGTSPQDVVPVTGSVPDPNKEKDKDRRIAMERALEYMGLKPGISIKNIKIDKVFIGSCTNGRIEDLREAAKILKDKKIANHVNAMVVPGSGLVKEKAEQEGLDKIFINSGFEWREPGCSMCLAMNADKLKPGERCASTSNRNFEGRQGRGGRTHLVSPGMAAAAAISGNLDDVRKYQN